AQERLYQLVWQRTLASQMSPASTQKTEITIGLNKREEKLLAKGEVLTFDGYLKVYGGGKDDTLLPAVNEGDKLNLAKMTGSETFSRAAARYSEASLVKKLEELGIGRPSTYASSISTIQTRGYVEKGDLEGVERAVQTLKLENGKITDEPTTEITGADKNKLLPTHLADVTTDFLTKYFPNIVDYDFTAKSEADFDKVAGGQESWEKMIAEFYRDFHPLVEKSADISRQEVSQARQLGIDPKTKKPVMARFGRYGPMLQRGETESEEKPAFAPLPSGAKLETVTLQEALKMFELPRFVGKTENGEDITANIGRFGPYVKVGSTYVSIKPLDPFNVSLEESLELYAAKLKKDAAKNIAEFGGGIKVLNGPYGPYITDGKKNARILKDTNPKSLSEADCKKLLAEAPAKKSFKRRRKASKYNS
ncbi:MAG: topoisomerase C-terminal repeat-containing protein, partial [Candidatus Saccharimonadales bacterium]